MGNPYPAQIIDANGQDAKGVEINFTDPSNQPGGAGGVSVAAVTVDLAAFLALGYDPSSPPFAPSDPTQVAVVVPGVADKAIIPVYGWMRYNAGSAYLQQSGTKNVNQVTQTIGYKTGGANYNIVFNGFVDNIDSILGDNSSPPDRFFSDMFPLGPQYPETELAAALTQSVIGMDLVYTLQDGGGALPLSGGAGSSFDIQIAYWLF